MKFNKKIMVIGLALALIFATGCQQTDVVGKVAVTSFDSLTKAAADKVSYDGSAGMWKVAGSDDRESLLLSRDFSSNNPDMVVEFDAGPFLGAGLDVSKLPEKQYKYDETAGKIVMSYEYGADQFKTVTEKSVLDTFKEIVASHRELIGYHMEGDHYMISLGDSNSFSWAKDMKSNPKDYVFALNPKPLIEAGVDPAKVKEWIFTKMPVTDKDGKQLLVDKFLKSFSLD